MHEFAALCTRAITNELTDRAGGWLLFPSPERNCHRFSVIVVRRRSNPDTWTRSRAVFSTSFFGRDKKIKNRLKHPRPPPPHSGSLFYSFVARLWPVDVRKITDPSFGRLPIDYRFGGIDRSDGIADYNTDRVYTIQKRYGCTGIALTERRLIRLLPRVIFANPALPAGPPNCVHITIHSRSCDFRIWRKKWWTK